MSEVGVDWSYVDTLGITCWFKIICSDSEYILTLRDGIGIKVDVGISLFLCP